jgi:ribokinase
VKIINFGSLNIDKVYGVPRTVSLGETLSAQSLNLYPGGKGLNQSVAAARAGAAVLHAGAVGQDGDFLLEPLSQAGVDVSRVLRLEGESGHAVIQVDPAGQNAILVFGGANRQLTGDYLSAMLELGEPGDLVLLQNETNAVEDIIRGARQKGLTVVLNPSPFPDRPLPYELVDCFLVNEIEGALLAGLTVDADPETILAALAGRYPAATLVLTLGSRGALCRQKGQTLSQAAFPVPTVDTTAAGDTFTGYFLAGLCRREGLPQCLREAAAAAALAVSRPGAAPSIPTRTEVEAFLAGQA